jgi:hypothetical protein
MEVRIVFLEMNGGGTNGLPSGANAPESASWNRWWDGSGNKDTLSMVITGRVADVTGLAVPLRASGHLSEYWLSCRPLSLPKMAPATFGVID